MRTTRLAALGLLAGFVAGIVLSEVIGIVGVVVFDRPAGIKLLPFYLGVTFAVAAPVLDRRSGRRAGR